MISLPNASEFEANADAFVSHLVSWYAAEARVLPWREDPSPYRVWVSEVMLQQTQVATVIGYFERWMLHFPDLDTLAKASEDEVMTLWAGLGYYRRAKNLKRAAEIIVRDMNGETPSQLSDWLRLPGVGPYTAGAICAFALGQNVASVDGNVERVLSRYFGIRGDLSRSLARKVLLTVADEIASLGQASVVNQAMMDLGAGLCGRQAQCDSCPLSAWCFAFRHGLAHVLPEKRKRPAKRLEYRLALRLSDKSGHILLAHRRSELSLLGGLWEFPMIEAKAQMVPQADRVKPRLVSLRETAWQAAWSELQMEPLLLLKDFNVLPGQVRHLFTHIDLRVGRDLAEISEEGSALALGPTTDYDLYAWVLPELLSSYPMSTLMHRLCFV